VTDDQQKAHDLMAEVRLRVGALTDLAQRIERIPGREAGEAYRGVMAARDGLFTAWEQLKLIRTHGTGEA
jgi:hypothetical protein